MMLGVVVCISDCNMLSNMESVTVEYWRSFGSNGLGI